MTYYNLIKLAEDSNRDTHTGKVLTGLGLAGAGEFARRGSNRILENSDIFAKALGKPESEAPEDLVKFFRKQDHLKNEFKRITGKELNPENLEYHKSLGVGGRKIGRGLLGVGGLLAGYGAFKNYQSSKNDPINMPSDATIRRHMKASEFY